MMQRVGPTILVLTLLLGGWVAVMVFPNWMQAAPIDDLPPRPTVEPTATPPAATPQPDSNSETVVGAFVELHVAPAPANVWTVIQWQDAHGDWHDVEGWRGTLDNGAMKRWWVAPKDFDTGPFRWLLYEEQGGELLVVSESFELPAFSKQVVSIHVLLAQ